LKIIFILLIFI
jgi:hypothetical protein